MVITASLGGVLWPVLQQVPPSAISHPIARTGWWRQTLPGPGPAEWVTLFLVPGTENRLSRTGWQVDIYDDCGPLSQGK